MALFGSGPSSAAAYSESRQHLVTSAGAGRECVTTFDAYHCTPSSSKDIGPSGHNDYNTGPDNSAYVNQKTS